MFCKKSACFSDYAHLPFTSTLWKNKIHEWAPYSMGVGCGISTSVSEICYCTGQSTKNVVGFSPTGSALLLRYCGENISQTQSCWNVLVTSLSSSVMDRIFVCTHKKHFLIIFLLNSGINRCSWTCSWLNYFLVYSLGKDTWDVCLKAIPHHPQLCESLRNKYLEVVCFLVYLDCYFTGLSQGLSSEISLHY